MNVLIIAILGFMFLGIVGVVIVVLSNKPKNGTGTGNDTGTGTGSSAGLTPNGENYLGGAVMMGDDQTQAGLEPRVLSMFGREHWYQLPKGTPKGLVAWFPGCSRHVRGFWPYVPSHPIMKTSYGFPEDMSHTKQILNKGYAILVLTPADPNFCWYENGRGSLRSPTDPKQPAETIEKFRRDYGLLSKPLFTMGASAGGAFAAKMTSYMKVDGRILIVATSYEPKADDPPTVWITMEKDSSGIDEANKNVKMMRSHNRPAWNLIVKQRRITPTYFAEQLPTVTPAQSAEVQRAMIDAKLIDASGKFNFNPTDIIHRPPKGPEWRRAVERVSWMNKSPDKYFKAVKNSPIWQVLSAAYAGHETVALYDTACFIWLENQGRGDLEALANQNVITKPAYLKVA